MLVGEMLNIFFSNSGHSPAELKRHQVILAEDLRQWRPHRGDRLVETILLFYGLSPIGATDFFSQHSSHLIYRPDGALQLFDFLFSTNLSPRWGFTGC